MHDGAIDNIRLGDLDLPERQSRRHAAAVDRQRKLAGKSRRRRPLTNRRKWDQAGFSATHGAPAGSAH
jgi:hypothetical protein